MSGMTSKRLSHPIWVSGHTADVLVGPLCNALTGGELLACSPGCTCEVNYVYALSG